MLELVELITDDGNEQVEHNDGNEKEKYEEDDVVSCSVEVTGIQRHHHDVQALVECKLHSLIERSLIRAVNRDEGDDEVRKSEDEDQHEEARHTFDDLANHADEHSHFFENSQMHDAFEAEERVR